MSELDTLGLVIRVLEVFESTDADVVGKSSAVLDLRACRANLYEKLYKFAMDVVL